MKFSYRPKLFILAACAAGIFFSCENDMKTIDEATEEDSNAFQTIAMGDYLFWEGDRLKNKMSAGILKQFIGPEARIEIDSGLTLYFYKRSGEEEAILTSQRGFYFENEGRMEALDSVVFTNRKGEKLLTEQLIWSRDSSKVFTEKPVTIYRLDGVIFGEGLIAEENFSSYEILRPSGEIYVETDTLRNEPEER